MYQVVMMPEASLMLQDAYDWYELQKIGLGDDFLAEVNSCIDKLEGWPIAYSKLRRNYRQIILRKFPYVLVFEIVKNNVVIYSVFHTSRNPHKKYRK